MVTSPASAERDIAPANEALGFLLRRFRLAAGLSQKALAERAELSVKAIA